MVTNGLVTVNSVTKFSRVRSCFQFLKLVQHTDKCFFGSEKAGSRNRMTRDTEILLFPFLYVLQRKIVTMKMWNCKKAEILGLSKLLVRFSLSD